MMPLALLAEGEEGEILSVTTGSPAGAQKADCRIEDLGLRVGKRVQMLTSSGGPLLLRVEESRIAVDRRVAMKILVRR